MKPVAHFTAPLVRLTSMQLYRKFPFFSRQL